MRGNPESLAKTMTVAGWTGTRVLRSSRVDTLENF
jgi:hypothetical protein